MITLNTIRHAGLAMAFALSLSALSTSSFAFTPEAQQMCTGDAFRLCSAEIPDVARITACMQRQRANLSPGCRMVMDQDQGKRSNKVATE